MKPRVSVILLNWNGYEDTLEALESLYQINYPNYNIIVVDNASEDESLDKIQKYTNGEIEVQTRHTSYNKDNKPIKLTQLDEDNLKYADNTSDNETKKLLVIRNRKNYGFAKGNNIAIDYTLRYNNPDYILLLNNDTTVDPDFLTKMVDAAENDPRIGIAGPKFYYYDYDNSHDTIWCIGSVVDLDHYPGHHSIMDETGKYDLSARIIECDWVSGAGLLIRSNLLDDGYLDTGFFFGCEDVDLAVRIKNRGYKIITVTDAVIWHKVGMSRHKSTTFHTEANHIKTNLKFIKKHEDNFYTNLPRYTFQIIKLYTKALLDKLL